MSDRPLISCYMPHLPIEARWPYVQRSIDCYCQQTYPTKELVIVLDHGDSEVIARLKQFVAKLGRDDIRLEQPEVKRNLGALRNLCREFARGEIHCQWDDDDQYHNERIALQYQSMIEQGADAVFIQEHYHFFTKTRELFLLNWRNTDNKCHQGTVLIKASVPVRYPEEGEVATGQGLGEDAVLCSALQQDYRVGYLAGNPGVFMYINHGTNVRDTDHHRMLATKLSKSKRLLERAQEQIEADVKSFDLGAGEISVMGHNGCAFKLG